MPHNEREEIEKALDYFQERIGEWQKKDPDGFMAAYARLKTENDARRPLFLKEMERRRQEEAEKRRREEGMGYTEILLDESILEIDDWLPEEVFAEITETVFNQE